MTIEQDCSEDLQTECFPYMAKSIFTKRLHALYKDAHIRSGIHTALHCGYYILLFLSDIPRLKGWNAGHMTSSVETKEGRVNNFIHASIIVIYYCFYIALLMNCIAWEGINKLYHFVSHLHTWVHINGRQYRTSNTLGGKQSGIIYLCLLRQCSSSTKQYRNSSI